MKELAVEYRISFIRILLLIIALTILSILSSLSLNLNTMFTVIFLILYIIILSVGIFISILLLSIPNSMLRKTYGFSVILKSFTNGFAFLFPFAVMALFSDIIFRWQAIQPIACAAIFTCISVSTSDIMKLGGRKAGNLILSFLASVIFLLLYFGIGILAVALLK